MKAEILKYRSDKAKGNSYLIAYKKEYIWINESDFIRHKDLLQVQLFDKPQKKESSGDFQYIYGTIELKEPLHEYYAIIQIENNHFLKPFTFKKKPYQPEIIYTSPDRLSGFLHQKKYKKLLDEFVKIKLKSGKTVEEILMNNEQLNLADLDPEWLSLYYEILHDSTFLRELDLRRKELIRKKLLRQEKLIDRFISFHYPPTKKSHDKNNISIFISNDLPKEKIHVKQNKSSVDDREEKFINEMLKLVADNKISGKKRNKILQLLNEYFTKKKHNEKKSSSNDTILVLKKTTLNIPVFQPSSKKHKPEDMIAFFRKFSTDEKFKWFTHKPDMYENRIDYQKIASIQKCLRENKLFKYLIKCFDVESIHLNISTIRFVKDFLAGTSLNIFYPEFKTFYTYGHPGIINKIKEGINPFEIKVNNTYFVDIINRFKHAIEFRLDNDEYKFRKLLKEFIIDKLSVDINYEFTEDFQQYGRRLSTYIDVNNFFRGIEVIINWINEYKNLSDRFIVDLTEKKHFYELVLFHPNSYINRDIDSHKLNGLGGDLNRIRKYWFSVVDFEIQADIKTKNGIEGHKIICLDKNTTMENWHKKDIKGNILSKNIIEKMHQNVKGVKYIIKILKN